MANPYASLLLNDLHHYFPDLLYHSERFQTVQDVLGYIVQIAQTNPYEQGRHFHFSSTASSSASASASPSASSTPSVVDNEAKQSYEFHQSSSAYSDVPTTSSSRRPSLASSSSTSSASANEAEQLLRALFQRRTQLNPISRAPANRFRISMPLDMSSYYSVYSSPSPNILQTLSQLSSDLLRPVIVRPSEEDLSRNTYVYRSEVSHDENCSICQDPMEAGQETRTILACSHCFHRECIDRWFQENVRCPTCRHDVREPNH